MDPKKKADLQRKLTLAQVPRPPADLLDRIKRDIPPHLVMGVSSDRDRFTRSIFFDMRVAASVLLIVTSAFLALQFFSHNEQAKVATLASRPPQPAAAPVMQPATLTAETARAAEPVQVARMHESAGGRIPAPVIAAPRSRDDESGRLALADTRVYGYNGAVSGLTAGGAAAAPETPAIVVTAAPPPLPAAAAASVPAPEPAPPPALMAEARAADLDMKREAPTQVFGISIDQNAFVRIKTAIEHGEQPESANIDVAALVNYFAGNAKHSKGDVRLEVEGSPAPVSGDPSRRMIRVTLDTATAELPTGSSLPPVATDASIAADFDRNAVMAHHLVGGDGSLPLRNEATLLKNTSVTALYDVAVAPRGMGWQRIATFKVTFTAVADGKEHTIEKTLRRRDLKPTWIEATRRHRLASLGAVWGETLKGMAGANDVARRAEELAAQSPEDAKARELANAANATSQLHGSASGSAR